MDSEPLNHQEGSPPASGDAMDEEDQPARRPRRRAPRTRSTSYQISVKVREDLERIQETIEGEKQRPVPMNEVFEIMIDHWEST
jgi:hypothetical protein